MVKGEYVIVERRTIQGKQGPFEVIKMGDPDTYCSVELMVGRGANVNGIGKGERVVATILLEQVGYNLRGTIHALERAD